MREFEVFVVVCACDGIRSVNTIDFQTQHHEVSIFKPKLSNGWFEGEQCVVPVTDVSNLFFDECRHGMS